MDELLQNGVFCRGCGKQIHATAPTCPFCGATQAHVPPPGQSEKLILPAFLLCWFFGMFGAHRFYVGKVGSGVAQLILTITVVGMIASGIWVLVDFVMIVCGTFTDAKGNKLTRWT